EDPLVLNEYREDLRTECEKFGEVKKVILFDVEETSREREERLKGWSAFLDGTDKEQQKNCGSEPAESSTEPSESTSTTEPQKTEPQLSEQPDEQVDSTDSSLAGSDNDEA
ncbi:hypothetical protein XENOCAPTIV_023206, partial [Xenoophorus captivus]